MRLVILLALLIPLAACQSGLKPLPPGVPEARRFWVAGFDYKSFPIDLEQEVASRYFKPDVQALQEQFAFRLLAACKASDSETASTSKRYSPEWWQATATLEDCWRSRVVAAFDDTKMGDAACLPIWNASIAPFLHCIIAGNMIIHFSIAYQALPTNMDVWGYGMTSRELGTFIEHRTDVVCPGKIGAGRDTCMAEWVAASGTVPPPVLEQPCTSFLGNTARAQCFAEAALLQYLQRHVPAI